MYVETIEPDARFDFIIIGAGSAGCILANRLTGNGKYSVLLIEAGGRDNLLNKTGLNIHIPLLVANLIKDENVTWPFMTVPQTNQIGQRQLWARGKVLGGSASINGNLFVRGDPLEYNAWSSAGCSGWSYQELLPYFMKLEDFRKGDPAVRGRGGPIGITQLSNFDRLSDAFIEGAHQGGYKKVTDYNDGQHYEGVSYMQLSTRKGLRSSSSIAYLRPARRRPNLTVLIGAEVTRILLTDKVSQGVEYRSQGLTLKAYANRETIVSAGPIHSPKILELSGIGNSDIISKYVQPVHHLPGVGENLRDHCSIRMTFECSQPITINDVQSSPWKMLKEGIKFLFWRGGLLSISATTARAVIRSRDDLRQPDLTLRLQPRSGKDRYARTRRHGSDDYSGFSIGVTVLQPQSVGTVHIGSSDPEQQVIIDPRYLSAPEDGELFIKGMRIARKIALTPAMRPLIVRETRPGTHASDDEALLQYVRETGATSWHMVGTCKLGIDSMSVVDPELRVHGIHNLRVIDSSVFPTIPSTNTNAPTMATAEKGADLILKEAEKQLSNTASKL